MRYAVPVKHLLLLLGPNTVVLVQEVQEWALWILQHRVYAGLEISQVRENALLKLLRVLHRTSKGLESKCETSNNIGTGDVEEAAPIKTGLVGFPNHHAQE